MGAALPIVSLDLGGFCVSDGVEIRQILAARSGGELMHAPWLWVVFTIAASVAQTLRNAMQRELISVLGPVGATQVRFLFGLPFGVAFLVLVRVGTGVAFPALAPSVIGWTIFGAVAQIVATALMLAAMRERSFVVAIAYIKTEAVQVAIFALVFLGERPTAGLTIAIVLATIGVLLMSWRKGAGGDAHPWRPAAFGLVGATFFALAAIGFRAAITNVATPSFVMAASSVLVLGLAMQTLLLLAYLSALDRKAMLAIVGAWRSSLFAGFMGALSSQFWYLAFALSTAARVRTLALIEVIFAQLVSLRMFREGMSRNELIGMALIVIAVVVLINS
jgi:drug/metabolite transporter (DMT)-like permease